MESILAVLPLLACPIGMGLMMWLLMPGNQGQAMGGPPVPGGTAAVASAEATQPGDRLAQLRAQLGEVQAQQAAIAAQLARLPAEEQSAPPAASPNDRTEPAALPPGRPA